MRMSYIQEFVSCAQHLNMRIAANELLMTQSNLSKHIKQLEMEIGTPLFTYASNRLSLTPAGLHFLKGALPLLDAYEDLQEGCFVSDEAERNSETRQLIAQQHSLVTTPPSGTIASSMSYSKAIPASIYRSRRHLGACSSISCMEGTSTCA